MSPGQGCPDQDAADSAASKTPSAAAAATTAAAAAATIRTDAGAEPPASGEGVVVGRISFCAHQELHGTLCTSCGRVVVSQSENGRGKGDAAGGGGGSGSGSGGAERPEEDGGDTHQVLMKGGKMMSVTAEGGMTMPRTVVCILSGWELRYSSVFHGDVSVPCTARVSAKNQREGTGLFSGFVKTHCFFRRLWCVY